MRILSRPHHGRRSLPALALVALLATAPAAADEAGGPWLSDLAEARRVAAATDRLLLVDLYADWCSWCKVLDQQVFSHPSFHEYARPSFVLLRVDVEDGGEGSALSERFEIGSLPTTLILDPDMWLVGAVPGAAPLEPFVAAIEEELAEHAAFEERFAAKRSSDDPKVIEPLADELHRRRDGDRAAPLYKRLLAAEADPGFDLRYLTADSLRLARDFEAARAVAAEAEAELETMHYDVRSGQLLGMLRFRIAADLGECEEAVAALESLLDRYPRGPLTSPARSNLATYQSGTPCT